MNVLLSIFLLNSNVLSANEPVNWLKNEIDKRPIIIDKRPIIKAIKKEAIEVIIAITM